MTIYAYVNGPLGLLHLHDPQPQIIFNIPTSFSKLRLPKLSDHLSKGTLSLTHLKKKVCIYAFGCHKTELGQAGKNSAYAMDIICDELKSNDIEIDIETPIVSY